MNKNLVPDSEALLNTDFRNPQIDKSNKKSVLLLILAVAMFAVVFIPWFCIGVEVEDVASIKLRAFGFQTLLGIVGGVVALVAVAGVVYRHYAVTFWASLAAIVLGLFAVNDYPTSRLILDSENKRVAEEMDEIPTLKVPGQVVELAAVAVEFVDQKAIAEILEKSGVADRLPGDLDDIDIINHRLGAVLYLIFSALAALLSYMVATGACCCKKNAFVPAASAAPEIPADNSEETKIA